MNRILQIVMIVSGLLLSTAALAVASPTDTVWVDTMRETPAKVKKGDVILLHEDITGDDYGVALIRITGLDESKLKLVKGKPGTVSFDGEHEHKVYLKAEGTGTAEVLMEVEAYEGDDEEAIVYTHMLKIIIE
jgi:hypothetical protein